MTGRQTLAGDRVVGLRECVLDETVTKIDCIAEVGGTLLEISNMYEVSMGHKHKEGFDVNNLEYVKSLRMEIIKWTYTPGKENYMKACKRISTLAIVDGNTKVAGALSGLFNGSFGALYQLIATIKNFLFVIAEGRAIPWRLITGNLDMMKQSISTMYDVKLPETTIYTTLNRLSALSDTGHNRGVMAAGLEQLKELLLSYLNRGVKEFMRVHELYPLPKSYFL